MGTQDIFVIERDSRLDKRQVVATHIVSRNRIDGPGSYRATLSYEAFRMREIKRAFPDLKRGLINGGIRCHWYSLYIKEHFDEEREMIQKINVGLLGRRVINPWEEKDIPVIHHESIWEFYKHIGYDYKRKKYI